MFLTENLFLFDGLPQEKKEAVLATLPEPQSFEKGQTVYCQNCYKKAIGILLDGKMAATGENILKRSFVAGDVFGAAALFSTDQNYSSEIIAQSRCKVQFIDEQILKELFKKYPECSLNYIAFLSDRVRFLNQKIAQLSSRDSDSKLLCYLRANSNEFGEIEVKNMSALCKMLGIGRTSLYRSIEELENKGLITKENNIIRVNEV